MVSVTAKGRCLRGTYSEASVAALGIAPPRPTPARKRNRLSISIVFAKAMAKVAEGKGPPAAGRRGAPPKPVAEVPPDQPANHHAERPVGQRADEVAAR